MQLGSRRSSTSAAAAAKIGGSVVGGWDSRTKMDQAGNGGGVVVNQQQGEEKPESCGVGGGGGGLQVYHRRLRRNQIGGGGGSSSDKKKKSWKSEPVEEIEERRPIRVIRKTRSDSYRRVVVRHPPPAAAAESSSPCFCKEKEHSSACAAGDVSGKDSIHIIRKTKSDSSSSSSSSSSQAQHNINRYLPPPGKADSIQNSTTTTSTTGSDCHTSSRTDYDEMGGGTTTTTTTTTTAENMNLSNSNNAVGQIETRRLTTVVDEDVIIDGDEKVVVSVEEEEIEIQVNVAPEVEELKKTWNLQDNNTNKEVDDNRIHVIHDETPSVLLNTSTTTAAANYTEAPPSSNDEFEQLQEFQYKLQSVVDLVMWKDVSKSAFVFGFGSFILLSSSYTKHLNFSMISAISYVGLFYLAAVFFYKSILHRGSNTNIDIDTTEESSSQMHLVVGEDEAVWLLRLILPYLNAFLFKFRSLFSGDPATTLLLAVILFVLARCGNSITTWKMAKLGFVGVFTIPKVCSSYALQLSASGKFWIRRFRDAWDSCSHKKVVASFLFTLVWNLFSLTARVWAAFMLVVAIRYYQQQQSFSMLREEYWEDEQEDLKEQEPKAHNNNHTESMKEKKGS